MRPVRLAVPHAPAPLTPADRVTVGRGLLVVAAAVFVVSALATGESARSWWVLALAVAVWALDAVDGSLARRTGTVTARGALLDSGVDGALVLVMSLALAEVAPWALVGGMLYPVFLLVQIVRPTWRRTLPHSVRRKVAGGVMTGTLIIGSTPFWPVLLVQLAVAVAVLWVTWSFVVDVRWLERNSRASSWPPRAGHTYLG